MDISERRVHQLWQRYRKTGTIPELKKPGRPKKEISDLQTQVVVEAFARFRLGAVCLEKMIDTHFLMHITRYTRY
jgi:transposase